MDFIATTHGKNKLVHDGYVYVKQKNLVNGVIIVRVRVAQNGKK